MGAARDRHVVRHEHPDGNASRARRDGGDPTDRDTEDLDEVAHEQAGRLGEVGGHRHRRGARNGDVHEPGHERRREDTDCDLGGSREAAGDAYGRGGPDHAHAAADTAAGIAGPAHDVAPSRRESRPIRVGRSVLTAGSLSLG